MIREPRIIHNKAHCLVCNETVESRSVHATQTCGCGNLTVDGGTHYLRRLRRDGDKSWLEISEYDDQ